MFSNRRILILVFATLVGSVPAFGQCGPSVVCTAPTGAQTVVQPSGTTLGVNSLGSVLYADQFAGSDIGAKINSAIAALPASGGEIYIPAGDYTFNTTINVTGKNIILRGAGTGYTLLYGTKLLWVGLGTAISVTGSNNQSTLRDFALDTTTFGTARGIDIDGFANNVVVERIVIFPQSGSFDIAVRIGHTANVADVMLRDLYIRNNNINLFAERVSAHLVLDHSRLIQASGNSGQAENFIGCLPPSTECPNSPLLVESFHATNSTFEGSASASSSAPVLDIVSCLECSITDSYFEQDGSSSVAIKIPSGAQIQASGCPPSGCSLTVTVGKSFFSGVGVAQYAIDSEFANGTIVLTDNYFFGYVPGAAIRNVRSRRIFAAGNDLDSPGFSLATSYSNVVSLSNSLAGVVEPNRLFTATADSAGSGSATLPAKPAGFAVVDIGGTSYKIPYYP